jgi:hypothetical protein
LHFNNLKRIPNLERLELSGLSSAVLLDFFRADPCPWMLANSSPKAIILRGLYHWDIDRRLGDAYRNILAALPQSLSRLDLDVIRE